MTSIIKVNNLQNQCGANTINKCGTAITVGASGDTVTLAAGASQSGFGQTYSAVSWDTTPKTTTVTGVAGVGYFVNTSGGAVTANLPAGTAGDVIAFADYAATWQTYNVTVTPNGSEKIGSVNANATLSTQGQSVTFVYVDSTQGWINTMDSTSNVRGALPFIVATVSGACNTLITSGDYKIAKFVGPGTFCVSAAGTPAGSDTVDYMVVAGGASGGRTGAGGGGAGGFRLGSCVPGSPPLASSALPVSATGYPITIGAGGAALVGTPNIGNPGTPSIFSTITSAGGGGGGARSTPQLNGIAGGSGGGGGGGDGPGGNTGGAGNTPPVSPSQGNSGGNANGPTGTHAGGGGGGASTSGGLAPGAPTVQAGPGGNGAPVTAIFGTAPQPFYGPTNGVYAGGGGGSGRLSPGCSPGGTGGPGGGGNGASPSCATSGLVNTGGGGGGAEFTGPASGSGGSGVVIIRYKFQ